MGHTLLPVLYSALFYVIILFCVMQKQKITMRCYSIIREDDLLAFYILKATWTNMLRFMITERNKMYLNRNLNCRQNPSQRWIIYDTQSDAP